MTDTDLNSFAVQESRPPVELPRFRPWEAETERDYYLSCREEGWLTSHGTMSGFDGPAFLRAAMTHSNYNPGAVLVVISGEAPVGILELDFEKGAAEGVGAISFVYVDPEHRRRGLGVQLLTRAVSVYRALGRKALRLRCAPENRTALGFYRAHGFAPIGLAQDSKVPLLLMERPLNGGESPPCAP